MLVAISRSLACCLPIGKRTFLLSLAIPTLFIGVTSSAFALDTGPADAAADDDSCWQAAAELADAECAGSIECAESLGAAYALMANCEGGGDSKNPVNCPQGTTACNGSGSGASRTCCPAGRHCETHGANAWCSPDNAQNCANNPPRTKHCPGGFFNGDDGACCLPSEECDTIAMSSGVCKVTDNCAARGGTPCGSYDCCQSNQSCTTVSGYQKCTANSCGTGEELCRGTFNICCPTGSCSAASSGMPSCIPTATPTPSPTPQQSPTPSPTPQPSPSTQPRPSTQPSLQGGIGGYAS